MNKNLESIVKSVKSSPISVGALSAIAGAAIGAIVKPALYTMAPAAVIGGIMGYTITKIALK